MLHRARCWNATAPLGSVLTSGTPQRLGAVDAQIGRKASTGSSGLIALQRAMKQDDGVSVANEAKKLPVLLVDVMGTIVRDPFHVDMPAFFGLSFAEMMAGKHPTAWIDFEKGLLTEEEFAAKFFEDRRDYDYEGLKQCMTSGYEYLEGMEALLKRLKAAGFELHILSNYPSWYSLIEDKLKLSQYLPWTFVSCHTGLRKPDPEAFRDVSEWLGVRPSNCIFIDDQIRNVEAASKVGMIGIQFKNASTLEKDLATWGISLEPAVNTLKTP